MTLKPKTDANGCRHLSADIRFTKAEDTGEIEGYASVFGVVDSYGDTIEPGAFSKSIARRTKDGHTIAMLYQHNAREPIGVWTFMKEDERGLFVKGKISTETQLGRETLALLRMKALNGLSVGFAPIEFTYDKTSNSYAFHEVDLWETSIVTFPANPDARISQVKNAQAAQRQLGLGPHVARLVADWLEKSHKNDLENHPPGFLLQKLHDELGAVNENSLSCGQMTALERAGIAPIDEIQAAAKADAAASDRQNPGKIGKEGAKPMPTTNPEDMSVKDLHTKMQTDVEALRKYAEEQAKSKSGEVDASAKAAIEKAKADIERTVKAYDEKIAAAEAKISAEEKRNAELEDQAKNLEIAVKSLEAAFQRTGGAAGQDQASDDVAEAIVFHKWQLSDRGVLKADQKITAEDVDVDRYREYADNFPALLRSQFREGTPAFSKAQIAGIDAQGGFLVPAAIANRILSRVVELSPLRELARVDSISTDRLEIPIDDGEYTAQWVGEQEEADETAGTTFRSRTIDVNELAAVPYISNRLLEDANLDIVAWMVEKVARAFAKAEGAAFINGDGKKKPRGLFTYEAGTGRNQIEQVNSGNASKLTADGLIRLVQSLHETYASNAVFLMNRATVTEIMLLKDGTGQYIWRPGIQAGQPQSLLGYGLRNDPNIPVVGAGNLAVAFGDFNAAYQILDRSGIGILRDPYTKPPFVKFRASRRVGGDVAEEEAVKLLKIAA